MNAARAGAVAVLVVVLVGGVGAFVGSGSTGAQALRVNRTDNSGAARIASQVETRVTRRPVELDAGWPRLFGPDGNSSSAEKGLLFDWGAGGPRAHWRLEIGDGYSAPVVLRDNLVVFHRRADEEIVQCVDAETGEARWQFAYPTAYKCRYEYSSGPYSTPVLAGDRVYAWGAEGRLHCLRLDDGSLLWHRSLSEEYAVSEGLFAVGSSPLLEQDRLILNVGGSRRAAGIVALDPQTGETVWTATDHGASYATPVAATIHGRRYVFVLTAEGLVSLDPATGSLWWELPFKPRKLDSCNAATPLVVGDVVFITAGPGAGAICLRIMPDGSYQELWRDRRVLDSQFNNLICVDGYVYGFPSKWNGGAKFRCLEHATGALQWEWDSLVDRGASLAVNGHFILLGESGHLAALKIDPSAPQVVSLTDEPIIDGPCYTAPALVRGLLYVRAERTLLCLSLRR